MGDSVRVLARLAGAIWAQPVDHWPDPPPAVAAWLNEQEFPDLATYWRLAVDSSGAQLYVCDSSSTAFGLGNATEDWQPGALMGFIADCRAQDGHLEWLS